MENALELQTHDQMYCRKPEEKNNFLTVIVYLQTKHSNLIILIAPAFIIPVNIYYYLIVASSNN
jgi:hypothetical protein